MELVTHTFPLKHSKPVTIIPIGDIQWAGERGSTALGLLQRTIERGLEEDAWFVGMGDYIDFLSPSNRQRLASAALYDTAMDVVDSKAMELTEEIYEKALKPTKGRWLGCVPLDTEILTRSGWKKHNELVIGEVVLGYNPDSERCEWTQLTGIVHHENEPMIEMKSQSFHAISTPDHRWYCYRQQHLNGDSFGPTEQKQCVATTNALTTSHRIITTAKAESGDSPLTPREAAVLGWIVTDGTMFRHKTIASQSQAFIYQSKPENVAKIRALLGNDGTEKSDDRKTAPIVENGVTRTITRTHVSIKFYVKKSLLWPILEKSQFTSDSDLTRIVSSLSQEARTAMLQAMLDAEGSKQNRNGWVFTQNEGHTLDAFRVLAALEGYRTGKIHNKGVNTNARSVTLMTRTRATIADMKMSIVESGPVWCPQTNLGSWIMRQGTQITITGNCLHGHHYSVLKTGITTDQKLCEMLDAPFLGTTAFIRLVFRPTGTKDGGGPKVTLWVTHGCGGGMKANAPTGK